MNAARPILGIDYGSRKMGIAVGQALTRTSTGLETIGVKAEQPDWRRLDALVEEWRPCRFVVGLPLNRDGTDHAFTGSVRRFAEALYHRYRLEVEFIDERLSSWEAERQLAEARPGNKNRRRTDTLAAQLILQNWLDA